MIESIIVALITGGFGLFGTFLANRSAYDKVLTEVRKDLAVHQAVTDTKIENLTKEVQRHNNFAQRMPVVENDIKHMNESIKHLEEYHK